jgi:hypothetical protein
METKLFLPSARQTNWLLIVAFLSLGEAFYLRYLVIENSQLAQACDAGLQTWTCWSRKLTIALFRQSVFGWSALIAAVLNLLHPSILLLCCAIAFTAFGLVLHDTTLAGIAAGLMMLSLARRAPEPE